jgi:signal transduction histidine kinase/HAMP domain-containing protein
MKIGYKLSLGFVGLTSLIVASGYFSLHTSQTALERAIGQNSAAFADQVLNSIDRKIQRRIEDIQALATNDMLRELTARSNARFENLPDPNGYIKQVESDWTSQGNEVMPVMVELSNNNTSKRLQALRGFYQNKYGYPVFSEIFVTNRFGANVAQSNKTTDYYQADEDWWQAAGRDGLFVSDVKYDESSDTNSIEIAVRIDGENGDFLGVIKGILNIQELVHIVNEAKIAAEYKTVQLHLINKDGKIIYSTKDYDFLQDAHNQLVSHFGRPGRPEHPRCFLHPTASLCEAKRGGVRSKSGSYFTGQQGDEKGILFSQAHSKGYDDFKGLDWVLLTETSTAEIFAPLAQLKKTLLFIGTAVMGLALLASSVTYRSIVIPLAELQRATIQIAAGNLDTHLTSNTKDEIGQLALYFQKMTHQLKKTIAELNDEIAERKESEKKLQNNRQFLNNIFDSIQDGISIMDKDLNIIKVNAWVENAHRDSMPLVGKKCFEAYHKRDSACPGCPSVITLKTGKPHSVTIPNPCKGLKAQWIEISTFPLKDAAGNVTGIIEYVKDVTEQRKAEAILSEKAEQIIQHHNTLLKLANMPEQEFDSLLRTTAEQDAEVLNVERVSIWLFNTGRTEIVCRDLFTRTGRTHQSGESLKVKEHPVYFKTLENSRIIATNNAQIDARTCEFKNAYLLPKGITSMIDVPVRLHGQIAGIVCHEHVGPAREWTNTEQDFAASVADMISLKLEATERSKVEKALEKLNRDLEATIEELSRTNKQMQEFVHIVAHDLKTPVRGIGTLADWIISDYGDKLDDRGREQVHLLKARVIRIDKLIEGMLQFSKIVRNRQNEKQINLNKLVSEIINNIKPPDTIEIAADSLPVVTCECDHIMRIFENLLSNAVAFMDKPRGLIKVGCVEQGDFWKFYVCDNGPGIEQRHFERIFKIFQTLPKKDEPEATGIGLAIAKKITEIYGGKIWVESQIGKGSTFFFTFPKQQGDLTYERTKTHTSC